MKDYVEYCGSVSQVPIIKDLLHVFPVVRRDACCVVLRRSTRRKRNLLMMKGKEN